MTEEEMKTKWCPHAIVNCSEGYSGNRKYNNDKTSGFYPLCLGSTCSQWHWKKVPNPEYKPSMMNVYPQPWPTPVMFIESKTDGYCGLAGQP